MISKDNLKKILKNHSVKQFYNWINKFKKKKNNEKEIYKKFLQLLKKLMKNSKINYKLKITKGN